MAASRYEIVPGRTSFTQLSGDMGIPSASKTGFVLAVAAAALLWAADGAGAATVAVTVDGIAPGPSRVFVSLCESSLAPDDCHVGQVAVAAAVAMTFTFEGLGSGVYAVAAFQDLNGDGTLDRSPHGLPLEPYGFSNNAGRSSAPRFERAAFRVDRDTALTVHLVPGAGQR